MCNQSMIFAPLGLTHTVAYTAAMDAAGSSLAKVYFKDHVLHMPQFLSAQLPEGGLVTTVAESVAFLRGFFEGRLFDPALV